MMGMLMAMINALSVAAWQAWLKQTGAITATAAALTTRCVCPTAGVDRAPCGATPRGQLRGFPGQAETAGYSACSNPTL
jgi:hypothetical protein